MFLSFSIFNRFNIIDNKILLILLHVNINLTYVTQPYFTLVVNFIIFITPIKSTSFSFSCIPTLLCIRKWFSLIHFPYTSAKKYFLLFSPIKYCKHTTLSKSNIIIFTYHYVLDVKSDYAMKLS